MRVLQLLPLGTVEGRLLMSLAPALADTFRVPCEILPYVLDPEFALHGERQQFHSSEILNRMQEYVNDDSWRLLGVSSLDRTSRF